MQRLAGAERGGMDDVSYIACAYADGNHRVPNVNRNSDGDWKFNLGYFENDWNNDNCLLCFCYSFFSPTTCKWEFFLEDFSSNLQAYAQLHLKGELAVHT